MITVTNQVAEQLVSLLGAASVAELQTLGSLSTLVELNAGDVLMHEGEESSAIFLVMDGALTASLSEAGKSIELGDINPGDWIGEVAVLDPGPATATVVAKSQCRLLRIGSDEFKALVHENSALADRLIRSLCSVLIERLRATGNRIFSEGGADEAQTGQGAKTKAWLLNAYRQLMGIQEGTI